MKLSDYVIHFLADHGVKHSFVVQGGAVAHLIDSMAKTGRMDYVCVGHEQAGAIAVHGYAAQDGGFGCAMATTGPGIINMINGISCMYYDSMPSIFIGGQVTTARNRAEELGIRQLGFQESPHAAMCAHVTKYSNTVTSTEDIRYELEKAVYIAKSGRPGPVFLDICDDVQRSDIDPDSLRGFDPAELEDAEKPEVEDPVLEGKIDEVIAALNAAERPAFVFGFGIHLADKAAESLELAERLGVPVLPTWGAMDIIPATHPLHAGGFGVHSRRAGNFAVQNCDLLISIGARLGQHQTGTPQSSFARGAKRVVVDIDANELAKHEKLDWPVDIEIQADAGRFIERLLQRSNEVSVGALDDWKSRVTGWRAEFGRPKDGEDGHETPEGQIGPHLCIGTIADATPEGSYVFADVGATLSWTFQGFGAKPGQRMLTSFNNHTMGYALPAAIGAAFANPDRKVVSLNGDGGFLMNIQELGVAATHNLDIAVFVLNNRGYGVIQQTQEDYFKSIYNGVTPKTGLMDPDFAAIAKGFGMEAFHITSPSDLAAGVEKAMNTKGPILVEIAIDPDARICPALKNQRPIEDAAPFLPRDVFRSHMIVPPMAVSED